jgi:O-antigen ligase
LLVTLGPLAFGAVDTAVQIVVTLMLGIGLAAYPPRMIPLPNWVWRVLLALMLILILKEVAPAGLFGKTAWRTSLTQNYGLALPWMHHPELGRAVDGWLAAVVAITWFAWVRTLAIEREDREKLAWTMLFAAAIVALVSFATQGLGPAMIYGLRPTAGWRGYGPFPNRNHTACFLAIGVVVGSGVLVHAASKKQFGLLAAGCVAAGVALMGLLRTQSRGGLVALAVGAAVYLVLIVMKQRSGKSIAIGAAVLVLVGTVSLVAGAKTLGRFGAANVTGDVSVATRVDVWHNALAMWRDAPLLGHGLGAFQSIFPMYQQLNLTESS